MYQRIVCLTEETVETLYLLGEEHRIVGVSGYAVRPARVRKEKPRVAELIEIAGGSEVFPELSRNKNAKDRIVSAADVNSAAPDIIVGSWCGKKFVPAKVAAREGFADVPAVRTGWLREIKSTLVLQPGPAALTDGLDALVAIVEAWRREGD